jgi:hypothetical protein
LGACKHASGEGGIERADAEIDARNTSGETGRRAPLPSRPAAPASPEVALPAVVLELAMSSR